jgi:hypothetical protein
MISSLIRVSILLVITHCLVEHLKMNCKLQHTPQLFANVNEDSSFRSATCYVCTGLIYDQWIDQFRFTSLYYV